MRVIIFGGTTEGRELSQALAAAGAEVVVSVASKVGVEEQAAAEGITVSVGRRDEEQMRQLIRGADVVVDATHPYAVLVTENIRQAAEKEGVRRLRLVRESDALTAEAPGAAKGFSVLVAADAAEAARLAREIAGASGRVLLTTGSKDLQVYASVLPPEHLFARVLPLVASIEACETVQIPHKNIIAVQGPFSEELNRAVIRDYSIDVLITKESGRAGGFPEKIRACESCGIPAIVIARPAEDGLSFDEVLEACRRLLQQMSAAR